ncbi:MAG: molybdopterin-dependent oxidoreductase, partial [Archangium sp.]|nr:molybdopterin-dependent oxidoreductase [Archangium sp.]
VPSQGEAWSDWKIVVELARALGLGAYFPWETMREAAAAPHVPWMLDAAAQPHPETSLPARFGTMTGKVEFASTLLGRAGLEPLPVWAPPEPVSAQFPLRLVTGPRPRAYINSQFHEAPSIRAKLREAEALVAPSVAERFNVTHGQRVAVVSPFGRVVFRAVVSSDLHPDTVVVPAGFSEANANALIGDRRDPISGFPAFRSGICRLEPVDPPL